MIIYLSLESKSSAISKIEEFLKKKFERVVFEDRVFVFYCYGPKEKEDKIIKEFKFYKEVQSFSNFIKEMK